jgi:hypothetical protein
MIALLKDILGLNKKEKNMSQNSSIKLTRN